MKERIKSIVLVVLLIMNLILGSQVLSTEKLWSGDGHNFFANIANIPSSLFKSIKQHFNERSASPTRLELPEFIIINTGYQTSRHLLNSADRDFTSVLECVSLFLNEAFSSPSVFTQVQKELFQNSLTAKSVYVKYPTDYDSSLFAYLLGAGNGDFSASFSQLCDIVIASDGYVYVEDSLSGLVYAAKTTHSTDELNSLIDTYIENDDQLTPVINYAFDLGFDKSFATQKTVLSPKIPIYSSGFECRTVSADNLLTLQNGHVDESAISAILPHFSMNPNGLRRYTEVDGTVVFVENNAILKVSANGFIEYQAKDDGVLLSKGTASTVNQSISAIAAFVDKINIAGGSTSPMQVTSKLTSAELSADTINVTLDYLANGYLVNLPSANAVTVSITNGRITSYKHLICNFKESDNSVLVNDYIYALDNAILLYENQLKDIEINGLEIAYNYDGMQKELVPEWHILVKEIVING